jgi:hypothetical protein
MRKILIPGLLGLAAATASASAQEMGVPSTEVFQDVAPAPAPELKALAETCTAHKFETIVTIEGRRRGSKVKICGEPGQSDADWLNTLRDSVRKTEADAAMAPSLRTQIVAALKAEIGRLEAGAIKPVNLPPTRLTGLSDEIIAPAQAAPEYSVVPPLPAPLPRAGTAAAAAASVASAPIVRPRLTIRCALPRESFAGCASLVRETQVLIRADEDIAPKTSVRFLRGGDMRAELELGALKKGETMRERLPTRVCSGVLRGKVQIQVVNAGKVAETMGPYALYCGS